jgi:hypothetical protein
MHNLDHFRFVTDEEHGGTTQASLHLEEDEETQDVRLVFSGHLNSFTAVEHDLVDDVPFLGKMRERFRNKKSSLTKNNQASAFDSPLYDADTVDDPDTAFHLDSGRPGATRPGFAAFYGDEYHPLLDLGGYDEFHVDLQTDGRSYNMNILVDHHFVQPVYQALLPAQKLEMEELETKKVKFSRLLATVNGAAATMQEKFTGDKIQKVGFGVSGVGPFRLEIKAIRAKVNMKNDYVTREERKKLQQQQKQLASEATTSTTTAD